MINSAIYCVLLTVDQLPNYKIYRKKKKLCLWPTGEPREARAQKPGTEGRGGAPELPKFLLIMTVY